MERSEKGMLYCYQTRHSFLYLKELMEILVTDGVGYTGNHICVELLQMGYDVIEINDTYRLLIAGQTEAKMKKIKIIGWELLILQGMV